MAKIRTIQSALNAGEISPKLRGRTDLPRYQHGLEQCRNAIPMVWGGAQRTPGTRYVVAAIQDNVRLIEFPMSIDGALAGYVLEIGDLWMHVHHNGVMVWHLLAGPYTEQNHSGIRYAVSANVLYLVHPNYQPRRLYRGATDSDWTLETVPFSAMPMMRPPGSEGIKITPSATSGSITLTASADWFVAQHVGLQYQINGGLVTITAVTDATHATATVNNAITPPADAHTIKDTLVLDYVPPGDPPGSEAVPFTFDIEALASFTETTLTTTFPESLPAGLTITKTTVTDQLTGTDPDPNWKEQAWSSYRGWPACITFHEQRMILGSSPTYPTYEWGSKSDDPLNFTIGTLDSDAWAFNFAAISTSIFHMISADGIATFAGDSELTIRGGSDSPITPSNVQPKSRTPHGSSLVRPVKIGGEIYFVPPSGLKLRGFGYQFSSDSYVAPDVALIADHLISEGGGICCMAYAREPLSLLWVVTNNGGLLSLTLDKEQEVTAWACHGGADCRYISCAAVPGAGGIDQVWFAVQRLVGGDWKTTIETLDEALQTNSAVTVTGSGLTEISGLDHLEGCLVDIKADGFYGGRQAVTDGKVTLTTPFSSGEAGLPYQTIIKDMPLELANPGQTIQGSAVSVNEIRVRLHESQGCTVNGEQVPFRQFPNINSPVAPFSGDKKLFQLGCGTDPEQTQVTIVQDLPFDLTVLAIIKEVSVNG